MSSRRSCASGVPSARSGFASTRMAASAACACMDALAEAGLRRLNALSAGEARTALLRCCGSARWADAMVGARPYPAPVQLLEAADRIWAQLGREDWLEAFAQHPRIGDREAVEARFAASRAWSADEQSGVAAAGAGVLDALAEGNRAYE